jgi:hypothetical protein
MFRTTGKKFLTVAVTGCVASLSLLVTGGAAGAQENDGIPAPPQVATAAADVSAAGTGNISLFFDSDYVDTSTGGGGEAENLRVTLTDLGFTVNTFTGTTTADWQAAVTGVKTLVLPELEGGNADVSATQLENDMEPGALAALQSFIAGGGKFVTFSERNWNFLEAAFGLPNDSIAGSSECPCTITAAAAGTEFAGGPANLQEMNATDTAQVSTFPAGTINVYEDDPEPGDAGVTKTAVGDGCVVYFGWDWFFDVDETADFPPWFEVLDPAVDAPCGPPRPEPVPEPAPPSAPSAVTAVPRFTG